MEAKEGRLSVQSEANDADAVPWERIPSAPGDGRNLAGGFAAEQEGGVRVRMASGGH